MENGCIYIYVYAASANGKWKPRRFSLIRLPFALRENGSLSFVCFLTKKQTEVIHCKRTKRTCPFIPVTKWFIRRVNSQLKSCPSMVQKFKMFLLILIQMLYFVHVLMMVNSGAGHWSRTLHWFYLWAASSYSPAPIDGFGLCYDE
jgi:hypothetical protein